MTMLDDHARRAVEAIERSVADYQPPVGGFEAARRRHTVWAGAGWALAGAAAAAAVVGGTLLTPVDEPDPATTLPEPTVVTTAAPVVETTEAPSPDTEVVPPPVTESPTTTEGATTTQAPTTTLDTTPPALAVTSPADGTHFEETIVTFSGETEPGATVIAGGKWPAAVDAEGRWSIQLVLAPGANGAGFVATDSQGNQTTARITVYYDAPEPTTTSTTEAPPEGKEFTANATYYSCSESPPYDVYYGTADQGTLVTISSEYGSASVEVNAEGHWEKKVLFEAAPYGVSFLVTVKDHTGKAKQFEFVSWAA
jgi:Glucodextranase, domain B